MGIVFGSERRTEALLQQIVAQTQQIVAQNQQLLVQMQQTNQRLDASIDRFEQLLALNSLVLSSLNVYDGMAMMSARRADVALEEQLCAEYSYDRGTCMLTQPGMCVLAHLLPVSTAAKSSAAMSMLQMTPDLLHDTANVLLLADNIARAFHALQVSFVPALQEGMVERYVLKIWGASVRSVPVFSDSLLSPTIGQFDGQPLHLQEHHTIFRRCVAFQTLWAAARHLGGHGSADSQLPFRMELLDEPHRQRFLTLLQSQQQELVRDIHAEAL
jgi:hypothetical protein